MVGCSTCGGVRAGYKRQWWFIMSGQDTIKTDSQAEAEQAQRDAGGGGRIERRVVTDTPTE